jgi:hypothetical protein
MDPEVDRRLAESDRAAPVAARLAGFVTARQRWLSYLNAALDADPRVMGARLVGSWGRGETDLCWTGTARRRPARQTVLIPASVAGRDARGQVPRPLDAGRLACGQGGGDQFVVRVVD